jgi:hypothetical protein
VLDLGAEQSLVGLEGAVEVFDGHSQVVDPPWLHGGDAIRAYRTLVENERLTRSPL